MSVSALERDTLETASSLATPSEHWTPTFAFRGGSWDLARAVSDRHGHPYRAALRAVERLTNRGLLEKAGAGFGGPNRAGYCVSWSGRKQLTEGSS